jgi:thymidylate synthase
MKYYRLLEKILNEGHAQENKKGSIKFLMNARLSFNQLELAELFQTHKVAKVKLGQELLLYMAGETNVEKYNAVGIEWWNYCAPNLVNSYPTYFQKLPALIEKINDEKRSSKNYVLFIGDTDAPTNQLPCLSLMQFQIHDNGLYLTVYQRSADANLGLPSDIYQALLISKRIDVPLKNITFFIGNAHIYENNIEPTQNLLKLASDKTLDPDFYPTKFSLNV